MGDWTCRCGAKNEDGWRFCEGCGGESPTARRPVRAGPTIPETHRVIEPPKYDSPPASPEETKAALARIRALIQATATHMSAPRERPERPRLIPPIDPAIREQVDRQRR